MSGSGMHLSPTSAALVLLLAVLCVAAFGRLWMAMAAAVAATVGLNFFFLPPVGALTVADPEDWGVLLVSPALAMIARQLSAPTTRHTRRPTQFPGSATVNAPTG